MNDLGIERSALLLVTLGEDAAAEVLKHLGPREVHKIGTAMAALRNVPRDKVIEVLDLFDQATSAGSRVSADETLIRNMLTKALGEERAGHLLSRILNDSDTAGIEGLKWLDAATIANLIKNEHPQIIATILTHLEFDQAAEVLKLFSERLRNDVVLRIATLDGVQPVALKELNEAMSRVLAGSAKMKKTALGGIKATAEILGFVGSANESAILDAVKEYDSDLAQKIVDEMFVFENLLDIDDRGIQTLLREVSGDQLVLALKGASPELREKIFKNMSSRAAESLREDLEGRGPVKLSEVEGEQKEILKIARRLAEEGQIVMGGKGGEEML
jgi:flagellar motor switch protein FliG